MRVLLCGDGRWAANSIQSLKSVGCELIGVVIRRQPSDESLEEAARELKVPVLQPANINAQDFVDFVRKAQPDLGVSISYNQILRRPILDSARLGFINFHAGRLPYYRGRNVINWAIINGEDSIGLTAHFVSEGIDTGDIIHQRTFPIAWTDTYPDVLGGIVGNFPAFVHEAVTLVVQGRFQRQPQEGSAGTYFSGRAEGDEWLDWSDSSLNLYNKIRAITRPGPGARTIVSDSDVRVWSASYDRSWPCYIATPGQIVGRNPNGVFVKTGDSTLLLREVEIEGGLPQVPAWPIGTRLGINLLAVVRALQFRIRELEERLPDYDKRYGASGSRQSS